MNRVRFYILSLVIGVFLSLSTVKGYAQAKQPFLFYGGVESMLMGDTATAHKLFKGVVELNKTHLPSYFYLSKIEALRGNFQEASKYMDEIMKYDTLTPEFLSQRLSLSLELRDIATALDMQKRLVEVEPNNRDHYFLGIGLRFQMGDYKQTITLCDEYEDRFGLDERVIYYHRGAYLATKEYLLAQGYMQGVVEQFPDNTEYMVILAELNAALGSNVTAQRLFDRAIEINPKDPQPHLSKAAFFQHNNRIGEYIDALVDLYKYSSMPPTEMVEIFKDEFMRPDLYQNYYFKIQNLITTLLLRYNDVLEVQLQYGTFLTYTGNIEAALDHYKNMIQQFPDADEPVQTLSQIYLYQEDYSKALQVSQEAYEKSSKSIFFESQIAALWLGGDAKEALNLVKKGLKLFKTDSLQSVYYALQGDIYHEIKKDRQCFASYKKALKYNPDNALVLNNYAYYLSLRGEELERAQTMAKRANELSQDNATYLDTHAWVLFCLGRYEEAHELMSRVMALDPNPSADVLMHYGDILYEMGEDILARSYWKKASEAGASEDDIQLRSMRPKAIRK